MKNKNNYFSVANKLFWGLLAFIVLLAIINFGSVLFSSEELAEDIIKIDSLSKIDWDREIVDTDSLDTPDDSLANPTEYETAEWKWKDFEGKAHNINFKFPKGSLEKAALNRKNSYDYSPLYEHDHVLLEDLIKQMKVEIKKNNLDYLGALEYVCSSIQYIPYTLVLDSRGIEYPANSGIFIKCPCQTKFGYFINNCSPNNNENGCCNNVDPFGVYSPFEFVYNKTGDCDTRALLAFTILKDMGFDVAVMVSESKWHSVLGIYLPQTNNLSTGTNFLGKKYVLWELTNADWRLGMPVEGDDWIAELE